MAERAVDEMGYPLSVLSALRQQQGMREVVGEAGYMRASRLLPGIAERLAAEMAEWPQTEEERLRRVAKVEADIALWAGYNWKGAIDGAVS